jgi:hypothetical protein
MCAEAEIEGLGRFKGDDFELGSRRKIGGVVEV